MVKEASGNKPERSGSKTKPREITQGSSGALVGPNYGQKESEKAFLEKKSSREKKTTEKSRHPNWFPEVQKFTDWEVAERQS